MEENYYSGNDNKVIELNITDFAGKKIIHPDFKNNYGLVKAYAPWCGYCKSIKDDIKFLSNGLYKNGFQIGAINCILEKQVSQDLQVRGYPSLFMVNPDGSLKEAMPESRSVEDILKYICKYTNEHSKNNLGKCCRKEGNDIIC